jgi:hypothetical protein
MFGRQEIGAENGCVLVGFGIGGDAARLDRHKSLRLNIL